MTILEKIKQPENRRFEVKGSFPSKNNFIKTVISFANGAGGELIIGVDDKQRNIIGVNNPFELEEKISNIIHDNIRPVISLYTQIINIEKKELLSVQILPGMQKPYYYVSKGVEKGTFIRVGSTNRRADILTIENLKREAKGIYYLGQPLFNGKLETLDKKLMHLFFKNKLGLKKTSSEHLLHYRIVVKNNGDFFPTLLGVLLFGKKECIETTELDYAHIKITKYLGNERTNINSVDIFEPPLASEIDKMVENALSKLPGIQKLKGAERRIESIIPEFALREAIINAVVHRDYSLRGSSIHVDIFNDRCEINSPGVLPGSLTIELLGQGISEVRNRNLARVFRKANYMEELGSGISRMIQEMKMVGNPMPEFFEKGAFFCVVLWHKKVIPSHLQEIYQLIEISKQITSQEIAKKLDIHQNTAINRLNELIKLSAVEKIGSGKNTRYQILP